MLKLHDLCHDLALKECCCMANFVRSFVAEGLGRQPSSYLKSQSNEVKVYPRATTIWTPELSQYASHM